MINRTLTLLDGLDLEPLLVKAIDSDEGLGWDLLFAKTVAEEYKKFLALCMLRPDDAVVPSTFVDDFWHLHILDTQKYEQDCNQYLGYFLHHFPYFGMRGEADLANLMSSWNETLALYQATFGTPAPVELWPRSKRCPNCGKRVKDGTSMDLRPRLSDVLSTRAQSLAD